MAQKEMYRAVVNSPSTTLKVAINSMDTTIPVIDTSIFATAPGIATIYDDYYTETIKYTGIDTTNKTLTGCTRGFDGVARDWAQGKAIARLFTAYDVNTFIDNIKDCFQFANDGKTSVASVIGSPTVATETFTQITSDIQTQKTNLATNLTSKGQSSTDTETLKALVDKVANITIGKQFASGSVSGQNVPNNGTYVVSGLAFIPKIIITSTHLNPGYIQASARIQNTSLGAESWQYAKGGGAINVYTEPTTTSFTVTNSSGTTLNSFYWIAIS